MKTPCPKLRLLKKGNQKQPQKEPLEELSHPSKHLVEVTEAMAKATLAQDPVLDLRVIGF